MCCRLVEKEGGVAQSERAHEKAEQRDEKSASRQLADRAEYPDRPAKGSTGEVRCVMAGSRWYTKWASHAGQRADTADVDPNSPQRAHFTALKGNADVDAEPDEQDCPCISNAHQSEINRRRSEAKKPFDGGAAGQHRKWDDQARPSEREDERQKLETTGEDIRRC